MDPFFEEKVKQAFMKVKEDMNFLKSELNTFKDLIRDLIQKIEESKNPNNTNIFSNNTQNNKSSTGNQGVYAFTHSLIHSPFTHISTHSPIHSDNTSKQTLTFPLSPIQTNNNLDKNNTYYSLQTLTNKEFLVFLTIYQLEKDIRKVTYEDLARKLTLTSGCIRSYITSLLRKKAPILKSKINNKLTILSIEPSFRSLTSEQKLINLYYQNDPYQSTLS